MADRGGRMVQISTDHVFDGMKGMYTETDERTPLGVYSTSKAICEDVLLLDRDFLVIRTTFMKGFPFERAFTDKYFNAESVEKTAAMIARAIKDGLTGLWNIAGERKSVYDLAKQLNPSVKPMKLADNPINKCGLRYFKDNSMDITKWKTWCKENNYGYFSD
jgi:dTDP-4-dehydrorhamnose reductase